MEKKISTEHQSNVVLQNPISMTYVFHLNAQEWMNEKLLQNTNISVKNM
ncbi:MAG: hypothetical protein ACTSRH_08125 [Promethearchaeota archaeon]